MNTLRALFVREPVGGDTWIALVWLVVICVGAYAWAMAVYRRRVG